MMLHCLQTAYDKMKLPERQGNFLLEKPYNDLPSPTSEYFPEAYPEWIEDDFHFITSEDEWNENAALFSKVITKDLCN